ncbi:BolA family protein [Buchnera aphidicola]|uniref:BolA family protein n=1 Tax=Buchnera aphidicola TaxID=9 RepID=UPI003BEF0CED
MNIEKIKILLTQKLNLQKIYITGDENHIKIIAIGNIFKDLSPVKKQQIIYSPLMNMIVEKHIHAISIESYTLEEWNKKNIISNNINN